MIVRESIISINETYESYTSIKKLVDDIYKLSSKQSNPEEKPSKEKNVYTPIVIDYKDLIENTAFEEFNIKSNKFIVNFIFWRKKDIKYNGMFNTETDEIDIYVYILPEYACDENESTRDNFVNQKEAFYYNNDNIRKTLLHELTHYYDSLRSNKKFGKSKKVSNFYTFTNKSDAEMYSPEWQYRYARLEPEIHAHFIETINDLFHKFGTKIVNSNTYKKDLTYRNWIKSFKNQYSNWDLLTPKIQKKLLVKSTDYFYKLESRISNDDLNINPDEIWKSVRSAVKYKFENPHNFLDFQWGWINHTKNKIERQFAPWDKLDRKLRSRILLFLKKEYEKRKKSYI